MLINETCVNPRHLGPGPGRCCHLVATQTRSAWAQILKWCDFQLSSILLLIQARRRSA